jgi:hypothetical protein
VYSREVCKFSNRVLAFSDLAKAQYGNEKDKNLRYVKGTEVWNKWVHALCPASLML